MTSSPQDADLTNTAVSISSQCPTTSQAGDSDDASDATDAWVAVASAAAEGAVEKIKDTEIQTAVQVGLEELPFLESSAPPELPGPADLVHDEINGALAAAIVAVGSIPEVNEWFGKVSIEARTAHYFWHWLRSFYSATVYVWAARTSRS